MSRIHPRNLIIIGLVLMLFGVVIPLLMVVRTIRPNYVLSFLSYAASVSGLLLGLIGTAVYSRWPKR